jgi:hypothetical protein
MSIEFSLINGLVFGIELIDVDDGGPSIFVLNLFLLRILI